MKKRKNKFGRIMCILAALLVMGMTAHAADAENIKKNMVLQVNDDVKLCESPDKPAAVTATLEKGTPVVIMQDAKDGWCMVSYHDKSGYVQISHLGIVGDKDKLSDEFRIISEEGVMGYLEADMAKRKMVSERIWGSVILLLVVAIFGAGILSAFKKDRKNMKKELGSV